MHSIEQGTYADLEKSSIEIQKMLWEMYGYKLKILC